MKIRCANCDHGAHNYDCEECRDGYRPICRVFAPNWEAYEADLNEAINPLRAEEDK